MKIWARIEDSVVVETLRHPESPAALFPAEWVWVECPEGTRPNASYDGEAFTNPPDPEPPAVPEPPPPPEPVNIPVPHFKMRFTPQERVSFKTAAASADPLAPYVADWLALLDDPRLEYVTIGDPNLTAALQMLVDAGLLTLERKAEVLGA
ncbi:MAG: hypothetical protein KIS86_04720 [Devosia sp.]|nr:hypothetical protein [Devosia sp.]